ncbi:MAG TPA: ABC transporter ATP-binding protein [Rhizomicrobium sp.]|jgi:iron complex transport system ATP-binding protein|nr:ABC transporter ATP-binding protein [Rhizomicrobium sp.]
MTVLAAENIGVNRGAKAILREVSFQAHAGEFIAVLGPNGAGKSTLLAALAGLIAPNQGRVMLDARPILKLPLTQLAVRRAYLPQNPHLEWPISAQRLVALGLTPRLPATGGLPENFQPAIARALEQCDLTCKRDQPATTLSGGEFARAMLARAIVSEPQILIVDEPITGLDPRHAMHSMGLLSQIARGGTLVIAALHDLTLATRYCSRVILLVDGGVIGDAETLTEELVHRAFGVRSLVTGQGDSRSFTLLSPSEK